MSAKATYGSEWIDFNGRRITLDGKRYIIRATMHRIIYPYTDVVVHANAEEIGCQASPNGHVYSCTDLLRSESDFPARVMAALKATAKRGEAVVA